MKERVVILLIVFVVFGAIGGGCYPVFDDDGQELLAGKDTRYYGFPLFWFGRPFYDDNDDYAGNGGQNSELSRRSSTVSYANVGAGWGR